MEKIISILAWPLMALILGALFIFLFKLPISAFIGRIKSVGKDGINAADFTPEVQHEEQRKVAVEELMNVGNSNVLNEAEQLILDDLSSKGLETKGDSIKVLARHLAATQLALDYEQIHGLIFGSQIVLLKRLNEVTGQGRPEHYMVGFIEEVQGMYSELNDWSLNKYLTFLFNSNLIAIENGVYHITIKGVDYLSWIIRTGHREDRAL